MLTIRGRRITPFILGSMSAGLNILIRHSFLDYGLGTMTASTYCTHAHVLYYINAHEYGCLRACITVRMCVSVFNVIYILKPR